MTETNEERLENLSPIGVDQEGNLLVKQEDWFWLSEQVERVSELEQDLAAEHELRHKTERDLRYITDIHNTFEKENERLRGAFEETLFQLNLVEVDDGIKKVISQALKDVE